MILDMVDLEDREALQLLLGVSYHLLGNLEAVIQAIMSSLVSFSLLRFVEF